MTMTTEKLAELKRKAEKTTDGFMLLVWPEELKEVIALAERALQPEEGQALIAALYQRYGHEHWSTVNGVKQPSAYDMSRHPLVSQAIAMLRRASQLALPAGPVPTEDQQAAVEFYTANPSAALFDLNARLSRPLKSREPESLPVGEIVQTGGLRSGPKRFKVKWLIDLDLKHGTKLYVSPSPAVAQPAKQ